MAENNSERLIKYEAFKLNIKEQIGKLPEKKQFHALMLLDEGDRAIESGISNAMSMFFRVHALVSDLEKEAAKEAKNG